MEFSDKKVILLLRPEFFFWTDLLSGILYWEIYTLKYFYLAAALRSQIQQELWHSTCLRAWILCIYFCF